MIRLRLYFLGFFLLLAVPCAILLWRAYSGLEQEAFFFYRRAAEGAAASLSQRIMETLEVEQRRPYTQYRYLYVPDRALPEQEGLNVSPLAAYPVGDHIPGLVGYFQIDPDGSFHTPLLPDDLTGEYQTVPDRQARIQLQDRLADLLTPRPWAMSGRAGTETEDSDETFGDSAGELESKVDRTLENRYDRKGPSQPAQETREGGAQSGEMRPQRQQQKSTAKQALIFDAELKGPEDQFRKRERDNETVSSPAPSSPLEPGISSRLSEESAGDRTSSEPATGRLEGAAGVELTAEVDPFRVELWEREWLVFHRKVWWRERRYIQGFVARQADFFHPHLRSAIRNSALPETTLALLSYRGRLISQKVGASKPLLLLHSTLPHAFSDFSVAFVVNQLPDGPGHGLVNFLAIFLTLLVVGGVLGMYRITAGQIELSRKKSDFVSAVSHELKTPLAAIRMYGEILMEGWVEDDAKRQTYYRHIHQESERLSRLIQNVLRLAELERNEWQVDLSRHDPVQFVERIASRLQGQARQAGFVLETAVEGEPGPIEADEDALTQILINLVDNALKFSKHAELKKVILKVYRQDDRRVISVRDFGPGIPRRQLDRIFERFYRVDGEMTRATRGVGIGLALVKMLAEAMGARVEAANQAPGAEFRISFPALDEA